MFAVFNTSFNTYLKDFVDIVIVWIAPWAAIFLVDWVMRRYRYVPAELQRTDKGGPLLPQRRRVLAGHHRPAGRHVRRPHGAVPAPPLSFKHWLNPVTYATRDSFGYGADFSIFMGMGVGALVYLVLGWNGVRKQADEQDRRLAATTAA